jgi:hypothetical protein
MEVKDLMIGDWVQIVEPCKYAGAIGRIKTLIDHKDGETAYFKIFLQSNTIHIGIEDICSDDIRPILLTPNILEKNGMYLYNRKTNSLMEECNHSDCFEEDEDYRVELSLDYDGKIRWTINGDEYTIMPLDYVHQLQHALRLCGVPKEITL